MAQNETEREVAKLRALVRAWEKAEPEWNRKIFAAEAKIRGLEDKLAAIADPALKKQDRSEEGSDA